MSKTDAFAFAYKVGRLASPNDGYCSWFYVDNSDRCDSFFWLCEFRCKKVSIPSGINNDFFVFYQGHYYWVIIVRDFTFWSWSREIKFELYSEARVTLYSLIMLPSVNGMDIVPISFVQITCFAIATKLMLLVFVLINRFQSLQRWQEA